MIRTRFALVPVLSGLLACASQGGDPSMPEEDRQRAYIGGWDGAATEGSSVLLIRDGLTGTLSSAMISGDNAQYQVTFDVEGDLAEDGDDLILGLGCVEIRSRVLATALPDPLNQPAQADEGPWASMDCAGWELELECGLAGECDVGDCNMVCDVVYFGDAYATAAVELAVVEDEFDHWRRV